jgi:hypothetical protein
MISPSMQQNGCEEQKQQQHRTNKQKFHEIQFEEEYDQIGSTKRKKLTFDSLYTDLLLHILSFHEYYLISDENQVMMFRKYLVDIQMVFIRGI